MDMYINGKKVEFDSVGYLTDLVNKMTGENVKPKDVEAPKQKENPMNIEKRLNELENNITALNKRLDTAIGVGSETLIEMYDLIEELIEEVKEVVEVSSEEDNFEDDGNEDSALVDLGPAESMIDFVELYKWYFVWDTSEGETFKDARVMTSCAAYDIEDGGCHFVDSPREAEHFANGKEATVTYDNGVNWKEIEDRFLGEIINGKTQQGKLYFVWKKSRRDGRVMFADGKGTFVECRRDLNQGLGEKFENFEEVDYESLGVIENIKGVGASYAQ
jgi:hypothetical protein